MSDRNQGDDRIRILSLAVSCIIGVEEWERQEPQAVVVDIEIFADLKRAGNNDSVSDTVDYHAICSRVTDEMSRTRYRLLEAFAEHVARICLDAHRSVSRVKVGVRKPKALEEFGEAVASVEITRTR